MSEPTAVGQHVDGFMATLERVKEKGLQDMQRQEAKEARRLEERRAWAASPEGQATIAEQKRAGAARCEAEQFRAWTEVAKQIGVQRRYLKATIGDVDLAQFLPGTDLTAIRATIERVRRYLRDDHPQGRALVLCGTPGTAKTYGASAALRVLFEHNTYRGQMFWNATVLRTSLMNLDRRGAIIEGLLTAPMLVLDDLGIEYTREGDYWEGVLDTIFVTREGDQLPMIVTSNLSLEKLAVKLGPRSWDRLLGEWGTMFEVVGESVRGKEAA
jgi:DNA replication protein DnaC